MPAWEHSSESGSLYLRAHVYRYRVINIYKQRMFLVQSNLFFFLFVLFIVYSSRSLASIILSSSLTLSLFFFLLENNIYIFLSLSLSLFLSHISSSRLSSARIEPYHLLTIVFVYAVSRRGYTLMKKGLFTINSPRALSHSSLYVSSTSAYIRFTHVFSFIAVWCTFLCICVSVYVYVSVTCFVSRINYILF